MNEYDTSGARGTGAATGAGGRGSAEADEARAPYAAEPAGGDATDEAGAGDAGTAAGGSGARCAADPGAGDATGDAGGDEAGAAAAGAGNATGDAGAPGSASAGGASPDCFHAEEYPNAPASKARFHVIPVPYEATVSYGGGTARGPEAILAASRELEAFDGVSCPGDAGIHTHPPVDCAGSPEEVLARVERVVTATLGAWDPTPGGSAAHRIRPAGAAGGHADSAAGGKTPSRRTGQGESAGRRPAAQTLYPKMPRSAPVPVLLGGEHSITFSAVQAITSYYRVPAGVVQIDAHADLREHYGGTRLSHACVARRMHEELRVPIVQIGVRALSLEEARYRARFRPDGDSQRDEPAHHENRSRTTESWRDESADDFRRTAGAADERRADQNRERPAVQGKQSALPPIVAYDAREVVPRELTRIEPPDDFPETVYITIDVDGLDPAVFPSTGTPVPGGLGWYQTLAIIESICRARRVVAFDVVELAPVNGFHAPDYAAAELAYRIMGFIARKEVSRPGP